MAPQLPGEDSTSDRCGRGLMPDTETGNSDGTELLWARRCWGRHLLTQEIHEEVEALAHPQLVPGVGGGVREQAEEADTDGAHLHGRPRVGRGHQADAAAAGVAVERRRAGERERRGPPRHELREHRRDIRRRRLRLLLLRHLAQIVQRLQTNPAVFFTHGAVPRATCPVTTCSAGGAVRRGNAQGMQPNPWCMTECTTHDLRRSATSRIGQVRGGCGRRVAGGLPGREHT